ncbi:alpha/beta hydrolase [Luethyella okanaganae]|uniref:Alpha/beta hydrolase n=1 Tax=Luethyella okanaganae TaxID=69372 RepID=A0ABW1V9R8_9MICO
MTIASVPFDPELELVFTAMTVSEETPFTTENLPALRAAMTRSVPSVATVIGDRAVEFEERIVPGPAGAPDLEVTVFSPSGHAARTAAGRAAVPGLLNIHGGGMMLGNRFMDTDRLVGLVLELGVIAANVEYRLAPEHPHPAPVEDCYAGLSWMAKNAASLGVDPARIVVMGGSAGGGLSAGVALLARDRGGPSIAGQLLLCPMIDDTNTTIASHQYDGVGTWTRKANLFGWEALLGEAAGTPDASPYAAPARASDLSGLPPAFIEAGSAELFRDENVDYASRIWAVGGQAELHIWSGGFHGFDIYAPDAEITRAALAARISWLRRLLSP